MFIFTLNTYHISHSIVTRKTSEVFFNVIKYMENTN